MDFKSKLQNRKVLAVITLILATIIGFGSPLYERMKSKSTYVRVVNKIEKGNKISSNQIREYTTTDSKSLPNSIIKNKDDVVGKYAVVDMEKEDNVLSSKISQNPVAENEYLYNLNGSKQAMSITIKNFAAGLSGKLQTGDIISVIASDYGEKKKTIKLPQLEYIQVLAVTNQKGADKKDDTVEKGNEDEQELPTTITLLVNETQAKILADLEEKSKMHVTLVYRGTDKTAKKFIEEQDRVINLKGSEGLEQLNDSNNMETN
ncbi:TPA: Flp pilus assembly protein CpaB [Clostridioides difficile]|nr:pilus assembly protein CpaB [Clostridioides difficile]MCH4299874.1 RcpC/CpaB family pilus assembly protein [Clostridioides difficile]MCI0936802.1 RcpC/CpaB family pilus assembly protein [Clostridioides difficile]MCI4304713.1 RcpC/CpaB family pilus assembly protein [Clostridioides difficile]MCM4101610.1 RcpC/CpaB family pilus assembly protein [Clostridioides difficile]